MIPDRTCEQCHKPYTVPLARLTKTRFCSAGCRDTHGRSSRREIVCAVCKDTFTAKMDHGNWPKYCSVACYESLRTPAQHKPCGFCGSMFLGHKHRVCCSVACRKAAMLRGQEFTCVQCSKPFWMSPSLLRRRGVARCCSQECHVAYYTGERAAAFKTGVLHHYNNGARQLLLPAPLPGYSRKYVFEHRLVASRAIGRLVRRDEIVIRVNRDVTNNQPENLFICESMSEYAKRRSGSLPWPTKSNLESYANH